MPLQQVSANNGWVYVSGVVTPDTPQPLGPAGRVFSLADVNGLGTHHGGLYSVTPSTAELRLYFDHKKKAYNDLGYIQFCKLTSLGQVVPPQVLPALASRRFYSSEATRGVYLEFMGPKDANIRYVGSPCDVPLYPLNAGLSQQFTRLSDYEAFCWHPLPNGSVRRGDSLPLPEATKPFSTALKSNCASLRLAISPFVLTETAVLARCNNDNLLVNELVPVATADNLSLFQVVIQLLTEGENAPPNVKDVQAVGTCLVITLNDGEEGSGGTVLAARKGVVRMQGVPPINGVVPVDSTQRQIVVWQIDRDAFATVEHEATMDALNGLAAWFAANRPRPLMSALAPLSVRGWRGLRPPPEIVRWPGGPLLELTLISVVYELTPRSVQLLVPRAGVATKVVWNYDAVAESLEIVDAVPAAEASFDLEALNNTLTQYKAVVNSPPADDVFQTDVFTVAGSPWYESAPAFPIGS